MIHRIRGDLLLSRADVLAHGVAPGDDFKQGLARALRDRFPTMYKDFRHFCHHRRPEPGDMWLWQGVDEAGRNVRIAALFTQEPPANPGARPGRAHTRHVNHALHALKKLVAARRFASVALPRLATGVGGLDWQHVEPLIESQLGDLAAQVFVYTEFVPGERADEPAGESAS